MTITRERHPFEGRSLELIGSIRRHGALFLLAALPDGSRSHIPVQWTDWEEGGAEDAQPSPGNDTALRPLGNLPRRAVLQSVS